MNSGVIISDNEADKYDGKIDKTTHEYTTKLKRESICMDTMYNR